MIELYPGRLRDLNKITKRNHPHAVAPGAQPRVDGNQGIICFEGAKPTITLHQIHCTVNKLGREPRFVGTVPLELRARSKTGLPDA